MKFILLLASALIWFNWTLLVSWWNQPEYQQYTIKLTYCDNRPAEVRTFTVKSGLPPELLTYRQVVPTLCFCGRGIKITNVCDYTILSVKYK